MPMIKLPSKEKTLGYINSSMIHTVTCYGERVDFQCDEKLRLPIWTDRSGGSDLKFTFKTHEDARAFFDYVIGACNAPYQPQ